MTSAALGFFENLISGSSPAQTVTTLLSDPPQSYYHQLHSASGVTKGLSINVQDLISEENIRFRILSPTMITCENITLTPPPTQ